MTAWWIFGKWMKEKQMAWNQILLEEILSGKRATFKVYSVKGVFASVACTCFESEDGGELEMSERKSVWGRESGEQPGRKPQRAGDRSPSHGGWLRSRGRQKLWFPGQVLSLEILQMFFSVNLTNSLTGSIPAFTDHCAMECPEESQIKQTPNALHYVARETGPLLKLGSHSLPFLLSSLVEHKPIKYIFYIRHRLCTHGYSWVKRYMISWIIL